MVGVGMALKKTHETFLNYIVALYQFWILYLFWFEIRCHFFNKKLEISLGHWFKIQDCEVHVSAEAAIQFVLFRINNSHCVYSKQAPKMQAKGDISPQYKLSQPLFTTRGGHYNFLIYTQHCDFSPRKIQHKRFLKRMIKYYSNHDASYQMELYVLSCDDVYTNPGHTHWNGHDFASD